MDRFAAHFVQLGYKRASAKLYISRLARFSQFAAGVSATGPITQEVVDLFLQDFPTASPRIAAATAIEHARRLAPERFSLPVPSQIVDLDVTLIAAYVGYLRGVKGLETKSCDALLLGARRFLSWFRDHLPGQDLQALNGQHVLSLVQHQLSLSANQTTRTAAISYIRTFLRFLHWSGHHDRGSRTIRSKDASLAISTPAAPPCMGGYSARYQCDRRDDPCWCPRSSTAAPACHDRDAQQRASDAQATGHPLAGRGSLRSADQGEARPGGAALGGDRRCARRVCAAVPGPRSTTPLCSYRSRRHLDRSTAPGPFRGSCGTASSAAG